MVIFLCKHKFIFISKIVMISKEKIFSIDQVAEEKNMPGLGEKS